MDDKLKNLNESFYRTLLAAVPCAIVLVNNLGRIIFFNRAAEELTGYEAAEMIGQDCSTVQGRLSRRVSEEMQSAICPLNSGDKWDEQCEITRKDGQTVSVLKKARVVMDENSNRLGAVQTLMDISFVRKAQSEIDMLRSQMARLAGMGKLIGSSTEMQKLYEAISMVSKTDASVVIQGETGTGKELIAKEIHKNSSRYSSALVAVNCGALPENLIEAELFGHVRGAFTGAVNDRTGCFEQADGGTLFLDEVGELPLSAQVKLLRAIQEGEVTPVGQSHPISVDVRIIAATNRDLSAMVAESKFREDLFYRLQVVKLDAPPLRARRGDICELAGFFIAKFNKKYKRSISGCSIEAMQVLENHDFPGNVRQLEHAIEHAFVVSGADSTEILPQNLPQDFSKSPAATNAAINAGAAATPEKKIEIPAEADEKQFIENLIAQYSGNKTHIAKALGITRAGLYKKLKRLGIS